MANWNLPTTTSNYISFVSEINTKFVDASVMNGSSINLPENTIRFNRSGNIFQEWVAGVWVDKVIGVAGGGTGATTAGAIRTNLGLGSMSTQNSNAVNITGGVITGVTIDIASTTGIVPLARGGTGASLALGPNATVLMSSGGTVAFLGGQYLTELNASSLTQGIVPLARLSGVGLLASGNTWTGVNSFSSLTVHNTVAVSLWFRQLDGTVGNKNQRIVAFNGGLYFQKLSDDESSIANNFIIQSDGILVGNGGGLTNLPAANLTGIIPTANLGSGVANSSTILYGDNVWRVAPSGGGGTPVSPIPSGLIAVFDTACPADWTRVAALDNRYPIGSTVYGNAFGSNVHIHTQSGFTQPAGESTGIPFTAPGTGSAVGPSFDTAGDIWNIALSGGSTQIPRISHHHENNIPVTVTVNGVTNPVPPHVHQVTHNVNEADHTPPSLSVVWCRKN